MSSNNFKPFPFKKSERKGISENHSTKEAKKLSFSEGNWQAWSENYIAGAKSKFALVGAALHNGKKPDFSVDLDMERMNLSSNRIHLHLRQRVQTWQTTKVYWICIEPTYD
jgi:hypothetical protein